jgi:exonuclease SbcD
MAIIVCAAIRTRVADCGTDQEKHNFMRIIHTSDWHLGQSFMGKSRQAEHRALLDWLFVEIVRNQVDVVLLAGDVFDSGTPPSYAREIYSQLIAGVHQAGATLVLLGGNHDSVATLSESRALLSHLSTTVVAAVARDPAQQVLLLPTRDGRAGAILCAVPFIRARDVLQSQAGQSAEEKQLSLQQAIQQHYQQVYQLACERREALGLPLPLPIIATGHLTTVGASASDSVREIYVGSLEAFPTAAFPPVDYLALGHIHRPQRVGGLDHVRYSGSPIALSFDEASQAKQVLLVELGAEGLQQITPLAVPLRQPLCSLRGTLTELEAAIAAVAQQAQAQCPVWLEVTVCGDDYLADLPARLQAMTADLPVEVLRIRRDRGNAAALLRAQANETLDQLTPFEVFDLRLQQEQLEPALEQQLRQAFATVMVDLQQEDA